MKCNSLFLLVLFLFLCSCKKDEEEKQASIDFSYSGNKNVAPVTVTFTATPSDEGEVLWDFGDGKTATGTTVTHVYDSTGYYPVYARLTTSYGTAGKTKNVNVSPFGSIRIYQIQGTAPALKPDGSTWDTGVSDTEPDLYFRIYHASGVDMVAAGGYIYFNNTYSVVYPFNPALDVTDFENSFSLKFLDYDPGALADDQIGAFSYRPGDYFSPTGIFPTSFTKTDAVTGTSVTVKVIWAN
jgi:PKD repeat protein